MSLRQSHRHCHLSQCAPKFDSTISAFVARSSRGLGCRILSPVTRVRIPYGLPFNSPPRTPHQKLRPSSARPALNSGTDCGHRRPAVFAVMAMNVDFAVDFPERLNDARGGFSGNFIVADRNMDVAHAKRLCGINGRPGAVDTGDRLHAQFFELPQTLRIRRPARIHALGHRIEL